MEWRKIENFSNYSVSDTGLVRNDKFDRAVAFSISYRGLTKYHRVTLFKNGVRHYRSVHRLVAEAFIPNPDNLPQVDHDDGDGSNNTKSNLLWVTGALNVQKSFLRNRQLKLDICSAGGKKGGARIREKAQEKYKALLGPRFIEFHPSGQVSTDACVTYSCACGTVRTASIMWKELRKHQGTCPVCRDTVNRSNPSLR